MIIDNVELAYLATLKSALKLEISGLRRRGRSAYSIIKSEFNLKGNKQKVYDQFAELVEPMIYDNNKNKKNNK